MHAPFESRALHAPPLEFQYVYRCLAERLRPELEQLIVDNSVPPGTAYEFNAPSAARRAIRNMAANILGSLPHDDVQQSLLTRHA